MSGPHLLISLEVWRSLILLPSSKCGQCMTLNAEPFISRRRHATISVWLCPVAQYLSRSRGPSQGKHKECEGTPGVGGYRSVAVLHHASLEYALAHSCQLCNCVQVQPETLSLHQLIDQASFKLTHQTLYGSRPQVPSNGSISQSKLWKALLSCSGALALKRGSGNSLWQSQLYSHSI